jgi:outer membrane beta-barrel protein
MERLLNQKLILLIGLVLGSRAFSAGKKSEPRPDPVAAPQDAVEDLDVESLKKRYWAAGDEKEMGVVQNRLYSKAGSYEFSLLGGTAMSDPFLSMRPVGASFGYHVSETWGFMAHYWHVLVNDSNALKTLNSSGKKANTVEPENYLGAEATASFLYGKLSLLGERIVHYDMHASLGGGYMDTENGNSPAVSAGIGQRFYVNQWMSLRVDYRGIFYKESVKEKEITTKIGQTVGERNNFTHTILLGVSFHFGGTK